MNLQILLATLLGLASVNSHASADIINANVVTSFRPLHATPAAKAQAIPFQAHGHVGEIIKVVAYHAIEIRNDHGAIENYLITEKCKVNGKGYTKEWGMSLPPHSFKKFEDAGTIDYIATEIGEWDIEATTAIAGPSSVVNVGHAKLQVK